MTQIMFLVFIIIISVYVFIHPKHFSKTWAPVMFKQLRGLHVFDNNLELSSVGKITWKS